MFVKPIGIVELYAWAGELDQAFEWLEKAYELRDHDMAYLAALPLSDAFTTHPRYKEMLRRLNLPVPN